MGSSYFDYIIGDKTVIPLENRQYFSEKIVYLPFFQSNDSKRQIFSKIDIRENYGISKGTFVFCCFNSSYKIQPRLFQIWMEILKSVENSILWLIEGNELFKKNLLREAGKLGVSQNKILFAPQTSRQKYLERYQIADLFLDTLPYNAHTTTSDSLWMGLPVLTCAGDTFASRVAGSLLQAANLEELITYSLEEYQNKALSFAQKPNELKRIKSKLSIHNKKLTLFDTAHFAKDLERHYQNMWKDHNKA
jgi:predicted O-linked N-acetylglucosamine transferase (SPINDLY family)